MENLNIAAQGCELAKVQGPDVSAMYVAQLDAAPKTRQSYARALRQWESYMAAQGLDYLSADREAVLAYKRALELDHKPATVNAYLCAVRGVYAWLESKQVKANVAAGVKGLRRNPNSPKEALTVAQARKMLAKSPEGERGLRDYAIVNLLMRRGLRTVEAVRANIGDVRQIGGEAVLYLQGKGYAEKADFVVLDDSCLGPLRAYLAARGETDPDAPLFAGVGNRNGGGRMTTRSISRICKDAMAAEGIRATTLTAHSLRHSAVTFALLGGATVQEAQAMARHRSINTTMIYAHNLDRMGAAAERSVDALLGV